ncbi:MAG: acyltransferase [Cyanobacteria bacterium P01_F01_bin.150]
MNKEILKKKLKMFNFSLLRDWLYCAIYKISYHPSWIFKGLPVFRITSGSSVLIGKRFSAVSKIRHNSIGVFQPVFIHTFATDSQILIGDDVGMSGATITALTQVKIGNRVLIGSGVLITDNDGHPVAPKDRINSRDIKTEPILIEDDVFIGARSIILKGVTIGQGSVIGAGSVVTKNIPPYSIAVGNPCRVVGDSRSSGEDKIKVSVESMQSN